MKQLDLKTAREARGWTQSELARQAGLDKSTVSRLEAGEKTDPSNATVAKLELALRLRRGTLVFGEVVAQTMQEPPSTAADRRGTQPDRREMDGRRLTNGHGGHDRRGTLDDRRQLRRRVTNGAVS